jgi:hypothetical protein
MNPDEKRVLERLEKLTEENNEILRSIRSKARWAVFWGVIKIAIFVVPFLIAYFYLEPYLGTFGETLKQAQEVLNGV